MVIDSKTKVLKYDLIFLAAAAIWGFTFVAQRIGMEHVGPFTFIAARFIVGSIFLLPFVLISSRRKKSKDNEEKSGRTSFLLWSAGAGLFLFLGASFQQHGLVYTTAGKAGFITGLYVVLVPILGLLFGHRTGFGTWVGAVLAIAGLYLLSIKGRFEVDQGDMLVFFCAFFWAGHVLTIAHISKRYDVLKVAMFQNLVCFLLALVMAAITEEIVLEKLLDALVPILYAGIMSTGIAFTLQVVGQRHAHPTHASILMSMEAVFAVVGGWLILGEIMSGRNFAGCALMLMGMVISQIHSRMQIEVT
ncbi:MAG: DMT family transporter [Planctomycetota bacterium]|jgi:drug/metabolite transporter (DMT)-like permease